MRWRVKWQGEPEKEDDRKMACGKALVTMANGGEAGSTEGKNGFPRTQGSSGWQWLGKGGGEAAATMAEEDLRAATETDKQWCPRETKVGIGTTTSQGMQRGARDDRRATKTAARRR